MSWSRETHISDKSIFCIIVNQTGIELTAFRLRQKASCVVQHVRFTPQKLCQDTQLEWQRTIHLCVLIPYCHLILTIYTFGGLIMMFWYKETHKTHEGTDNLSLTQWGSKLYIRGPYKPNYCSSKRNALVVELEKRIILLTLWNTKCIMFCMTFMTKDRLPEVLFPKV